MSVYWILFGPRSTASSRIHGYRVHEFLLTRGWTSTILFSPLHWVFDVPLDPAETVRRLDLGRDDVLVFQKVRGPRTQAWLRQLRESGVKTVYVDCDLPLKLEESALASWTVCSSSQLAGAYRLAGAQRVTCVPDAFEVSACPRARGAGLGRFQCLWFGFGGAPATWATVQRFKEEIIGRLPGWSFKTLSDHPHADQHWSLDTCWDVIRSADAVAIPSRDDSFSSMKSANRAIQAMALGVPVLAFPIPSYVEVIRNAKNGFLCREPAEWRTALQTLEKHETWTRVSWCAYRFARRYFGMERVGAMWMQLLATLGQSAHDPQRRLGDRAEAIARTRSLYWASVADQLPAGSPLQRDYLELASGTAGNDFVD